MSHKYKNKIALITGSSRGLGKYLSIELAKKGFEIILVARTTGALEEQYDKIEKIGSKSTIVPFDLSDHNVIDNLGYEINKKWGKLDLFISNAAITTELTPLAHLKPDDWDKVINLNLTTNFRLIRSLENLLKLSKSASCLFILDQEVNEDKPYNAPYSASKAGLKKMIAIWAKEVAKDNINVHYCHVPRMNTFLRKKIVPGLNDKDFKSPKIVAQKIIENLLKFNKKEKNFIEISC